MPINPQKRGAYKILFSNYNPSGNTVREIKKLGLQIMESKYMNYNILVMDELIRSIKFLASLNRGKYNNFYTLDFKI